MTSFDYTGKKIFYRDSKKGIPVLFIHAFGLDSSAYLEFVKPLESNYRIIIPDLPGIAMSEALDNYQMSVLADIMEALRKELKIKTWAVVGHSIGGYIALEMLQLFPISISQLLLLHSYCFADSSEKKLARSKQIEFIKTHNTAIFIKELIGNLFDKDFILLNKFLIDSLIHTASHWSKSGIIGLITAMRDRNDRSELLSNTTIPIGFILSTQDKAIPLQPSIEQTKLPSISYVAFPPGSTHMSIFENPPAARQALENFLLTNQKVYSVN